MPTSVPAVLAAWMQPFAASFTPAVWRHVLVLIAGSLLAPGRRTVTAALRVMGLDQGAGFAVYHRVLIEPQHAQATLNDALLYAQASERGHVVLTRNIREFDFFDQIWPGERVLFYRAACPARQTASPILPCRATLARWVRKAGSHRRRPDVFADATSAAVAQ